MIKCSGYISEEYKNSFVFLFIAENISEIY